MFQNAFTDATWVKGLHNYLTKMQYKSATSADLYDGLQSAVDEDFPLESINVSLVMSSWELQSGFPYVHVSRIENLLILEQNRFMNGNGKSNNLWWIPISYRIVGRNEFDDSTVADFWFPQTSLIVINGTKSSRKFTSTDLVIINYQQSGYYRVNYDNELWNEFINVLNNRKSFSLIHPLNRAQLIDDSFHFAKENMLDFSIVLSLMNYLEMETDYVPWVAAYDAHIGIRKILTGTEAYPKYREFMRKNVAAVFMRLGVDVIEGEPRVDRYLRKIAINIACSMGFENCKHQTTAKLHESITQNRPLHPDIMESIYCNGIRHADSFLLKKAFTKALETRNVEERLSILEGLGCTENMEILEKYLNFGMSSKLTNDEKFVVLKSVLKNENISIPTMLIFVQRNYHELAMEGLLHLSLESIASRVSNLDSLIEFTILIDQLLANNLMTIDHHNMLLSISEKILELHDNYLEHFDEFFNGY